MQTAAGKFNLDAFGHSERAALDYLLREFRLRGWRDDDDAAAAIVSALVRRGGSAPRRMVLRSIPRDFLDRNAIGRADVARLLDRLSSSGGRP